MLDARISPADRMPLHDRAVVLDCGAHNGTYTEHALRTGAMFVLAVEPLDTNCRDWHIRMQKWPTKRRALLPGAAVNMHYCSNRVPLMRGEDEFTCSTVGSGTAVPVPALPFHALLKGCTHLKLDVEGAEYSLEFWEHIQQLQALAVDFHPPQVQAEAAVAEIERQGFVPLVAPTFEDKRHWDGIWIRK